MYESLLVTYLHLCFFVGRRLTQKIYLEHITKKLRTGIKKMVQTLALFCFPCTMYMFRHVHNSLYMYVVHLLDASSSKETILLTMLPVFVKLSGECPIVTEKKESRAGVGAGGYFFPCWQERE
jgi:hypothetical protein